MKTSHMPTKIKTGTPAQRRKFLAEQKIMPPVPTPQPGTLPSVKQVLLGPDANRLTEDDFNFLSCVVSELVRARSKFPSSIHCFAALVEEVGELGKALISEDETCVDAEAMQTAVMAIRVATEGDTSFAVYRNMKGL